MEMVCIHELVLFCKAQQDIPEPACFSDSSLKGAVFSFKSHYPQGSHGAKFMNELRIVLKEVVLAFVGEKLQVIYIGTQKSNCEDKCFPLYGLGTSQVQVLSRSSASATLAHDHVLLNLLSEPADAENTQFSCALPLIFVWQSY